jgi:hypothetical protein
MHRDILWARFLGCWEKRHLWSFGDIHAGLSVSQGIESLVLRLTAIISLNALFAIAIQGQRQKEK